MANIHALLIGINNYHPDSGVTSLEGCRNDIAAFKDYLVQKQNTPDKQITVLLDEEATKEKLIESFLNQFCHNTNILAGDTLVLYYSGHGSYAPTAKELAALDLDGANQDETLVLYDSRLPGKTDLADKELALLLSKANKDANMVVILDSCHSGSATRNAEPADMIRMGKARLYPSDKSIKSRELPQYAAIDGLSYEKMQQDGKLEIPLSKHILLAACGRNELAWESPYSRGLFSLALTKLLSAGNSTMTYAEIFENIYPGLKQQAKKQTPQIKPYGGFDQNLRFLDNQQGTGKAYYEVVHDGNNWIVNIGALHGVSPDTEKFQQLKVALYDKGDLTQQLGTATFKKVNLVDSILQVTDVNTKNRYVADVLNLSPDLVVFIEGNEADKKFFLDTIEKGELKKKQVLFHEDTSAFADVILEVNNENLVISNAANKQLIHGINNLSETNITYIIKCLEQIAKWKNLASVESMEDNFDKIEFALQIKNASGEWEDCIGNNITIDLPGPTFEKEFLLKLISHSDTPVYFGLYYLSSAYGIIKHKNDIDGSILKKGNKSPIPFSDPGDPYKLAIASETNNEETEIYKLVISKEAFQDYFITQWNDLPAEIIDSEPGRFKAVKEPTKSNWAIRTLTIRLVKQTQKVNSEKGFSNNIVSIEPHKDFECTVGVTGIEPGSKSVSPIAALKNIFSDDEFSFINLAEKSKGDIAIDSSVIELSGIQNESTLQEDPLKINLKYKLEENEQVIAVTYDQGLVIPLGLLEKSADSDSHTLQLYQAPASIDPQRAAARNPIRALWFCFLKVVLKKDDEVFKLRYVEYEKGKVKYVDKDVAARLQKSARPLLLIHGIIGNTKSIAASMEFLLMNKQYDGIFTFDYENLNTGIETIASRLLEKLTQAGISENKKIDIIAHSMGGLVSRYMIEKLGADIYVSKLYLAGTPSFGSAFGKIVTLRNWATGVLTLVCNYGKQFLGQFGPFVEAVNKGLSATHLITNSLDQMRPDSDFIKTLNQNPSPILTRYYILAGDTSQYIPEEGSALKTGLENFKVFIGKLAYWNTINDIAVSVESIRHVPAIFVEEEKVVGCHHLNYFECEVGMKALKELMD